MTGSSASKPTLLVRRLRGGVAHRISPRLASIRREARLTTSPCSVYSRRRSLPKIPQKARPVATPTVHDRPMSSSSRRSVSAAVIGAPGIVGVGARGQAEDARERHSLVVDEHLGGALEARHHPLEGLHAQVRELDAAVGGCPPPRGWP